MILSKQNIQGKGIRTDNILLERAEKNYIFMLPIKRMLGLSSRIRCRLKEASWICPIEWEWFDNT